MLNSRVPLKKSSEFYFSVDLIKEMAMHLPGRVNQKVSEMLYQFTQMALILIFNQVSVIILHRQDYVL